MEWKKVKVLGAGSYGTVHLVVSSLRSSVIAVKSAGVSFAVDSLEREAGVLRHLAGAPNVLRCFGEDESLEENNKPTYNLLLEYAPLGSLEDLIRSVGPMPEFTVACHASMLLRGLAGIHSRGLAHCDLKSANILVFPGPNEYIKNLKIADLGLAKWEAEGYFQENPTWEGSGKAYYNRGTAMTASPESVCGGFHGPPADVWSVGCIIYEMMTGKCVWKYNGSMVYLYDQILHHPIPFPRDLSPIGVDFLKRCLNRDVASRWSAEKLLKHPFIVENLRGVNLMTRNAVPLQPWISTTHMFSKTMMEPAGSCYYANAGIDSYYQDQLQV